ncbi:MAG: hypothetical protein ACR2JU_07610 [Nocardioidaceae bacterium]
MTQLLTMRDVAELAGVQRPVVSMWRQRRTVRGHAVDFPAPVRREGRVDLFDRTDIELYLAETGRGNNREAGLDAASFAVPEADLETVIALLVLAKLAGDGIGEADLAQLAEAHDPDDELLRSEVASASAETVRYVDDLMAASYGPADALARLDSSRMGRGRGRGELADDGVRLVAAVARALLVHLGSDRAQLVDGSAGRAEFGLDVAQRLDRGLVVAGERAPTRGLRRRAALSGHLADAATGPRVRLEGLIGLDPEDALRRLDDLQLELGGDDVGLAVGPASVLCDRLSPELDRQRDELLREHRRVRAVVRLPRGLWRGAPRMALGLWVCAGSVPTSDRIALADLGDLAPAEIDAETLATDLVAAVADDPRRAKGYLLGREAGLVRAWQYVVPRGFRVASASTTVDQLVAVRRELATFSEPLPDIGVAPTPAGGSALRRVTLAALRAERLVRLVSGSRLDLAWADPAGTVEIADLTGAWPTGTAFDPLELEARAPRAIRTEPGDLVFTSNPPRAQVDDRGGRVVATPNRVLRLAEQAPLGPHTLAAQINQLAATATDPDAWPIALPDGSRAEHALAQLDAVRRDLDRRRAGLERLTTHLVGGLADGSLTLDSPDEDPTTKEND